LFKENSGAENQAIMNLMDRIANERQLFFNAVDHFGKDQSRGIIGPIEKYNSADVIRYVTGDKEGNAKPTNLRMVGEKVRSGKGTLEMPFEMVPVSLNGNGYTDDNGNGTTEITVKWLDGATRTSKARLSASARRVLKAVLETIDDFGTPTAIGGTSGIVKATVLTNTLNSWLKVDRETDDEKADYKRSEQRWRRALPQLVERGLIGKQVLENGEVFLWDPKTFSNLHHTLNEVQ
jgi:hypothetical protein